MPQSHQQRGVFYRLLLVLPMLALLCGMAIDRDGLAAMGKWAADARKQQCRALMLAYSISSGQKDEPRQLVAESLAKTDALRSVRPAIVEVQEIEAGQKLLASACETGCSELAVEASKRWGEVAKRVSVEQRDGIAGSLSWLQIGISAAYIVAFSIWAWRRKT